MNRNELDGLSRQKLQNLAKQHGIKANLSSKKIIEELLVAFGASSSAAVVSMKTNEDKKPENNVKKSVKSKAPKRKKNEVGENEDEFDNSQKRGPTSSVTEIPQYWGSVLEGSVNPAAAYDAAFGQGTRYASIAMISEPYVMALFRRGGATGVSRDAVSEVKKLLMDYIVKCCNSTETNNGLIGPNDVKNACRRFGFRLMGGNAIAPCSHVDFVAHMKETGKKEGVAWDVFSHALTSIRLVPFTSVYTFAAMKKLLDAGRATFSESNSQNPSPIAQACSSLDSYLFRYLLSFLAMKPRKQKYCKNVKLFTDDDDIFDNWDNEVTHNSLDSALKENVDVLKASDDHSGATLLHTFACSNRPDDSQRLIEMGMDVNVATYGGFENGDGWGELEYCAFNPLHFACSNGYFGVAKVLLRNGAAINTAAWDGGSHVPLTQQSDYWYTSNNTPLHQAARGNHASIIHLLLDGPDSESLAYAEAKGIDLSAWKEVDVDDPSPSVTIYDDNGNEKSIEGTPLTFALLFGNLDAAIALLEHGADINAVAPSDKWSRDMIIRSISKENGVMFQQLKISLDIFNHPDSEALNKVFEENEDDEDEEEPWERDDWNECQVPEGDSQVFHKDNEDDDDCDAEPRPLSSEECPFAQNILEVMLMVHPDFHMSKNSQIVMNDFVEFILEKLFDEIVRNAGSSLTMDNLISVIPNIVHGDLIKHAISESKKAVNENAKTTFLDDVASFLDSTSIPVTTSDEGLRAASLFIDYCVAEVLEMGGNCSRDCRLRCLHPDHIFCLNDDELEESFLTGCTMGSAFRFCHENIVFTEKVDAAINTTHDFFQQDWVTPQLIKSSLSPEFILNMREIRLCNKYKYGLCIPASAFDKLLEGRCDNSFSEEGARAVQVMCERALIDIISRATRSWKKRTQEAGYMDFPFVTASDIVTAHEEFSNVLQGRVCGH